jgi:hypothetical protein
MIKLHSKDSQAMDRQTGIQHLDIV